MVLLDYLSIVVPAPIHFRDRIFPSHHQIVISFSIIYASWYKHYCHGDSLSVPRVSQWYTKYHFNYSELRDTSTTAMEIPHRPATPLNRQITALNTLVSLTMLVRRQPECESSLLCLLRAWYFSYSTRPACISNPWIEDDEPQRLVRLKVDHHRLSEASLKYQTWVERKVTSPHSVSEYMR